MLDDNVQVRKRLEKEAHSNVSSKFVGVVDST